MIVPPAYAGDFLLKTGARLEERAPVEVTTNCPWRSVCRWTAEKNQQSP